MSFRSPPLLALLAACAANTGTPPIEPDLATPALDGISVTHAAVGEPVEFRGSGFVEPALGWVDVTFEGTFFPEEGEPEEVVETIPLARDEEDPRLVRWPRFGTYAVPWGDGATLGRFEGTVYATNRFYTGEVVTQPSETRLALRFEVDPSIVVTRFHAMDETFVADCAEPATTALQQIPYGMAVKALGFDPARVRFTVSPGWMQAGEIQESAGTFEQTSAVGENLAAMVLAFAPVPEHQDGYAMQIEVFMDGGEGIDEHVLTYPFVVRRPVQAYFEQRARIAEIFPPEQVSGCIPGGDTIRQVTYSESRTETRTRSLSHTESAGWTETYGREHSESWGLEDSVGGRETEGRMVTTTNTLARGGSTAMSTNVTDTAGRERVTTGTVNGSAGGEVQWRVGADRNAMWSAGATVGAEGEAGIPLVANGKVSAQASSQYGRSWSGDFDATQDCLEDGREDCTIDRVGEVTRVEGEEWESGWSQSTSDRASRERSVAVGRSSTASWMFTQSRAEANSFSRERNWSRSRSYNQSVQRSQSIASSLGESLTETLTVSTSESTTLSISGPIFVGQFGVWYRQTTRLVRHGVLVAYDLCGNGSPVARLTIDDWTWAPDLANGPSCPPAPEPNLPPAQCLEPPCTVGD